MEAFPEAKVASHDSSAGDIGVDSCWSGHSHDPRIPREMVPKCQRIHCSRSVACVTLVFDRVHSDYCFTFSSEMSAVPTPIYATMLKPLLSRCLPQPPIHCCPRAGQTCSPALSTMGYTLSVPFLRLIFETNFRSPNELIHDAADGSLTGPEIYTGHVALIRAM